MQTVVSASPASLPVWSSPRRRAATAVQRAPVAVRAGILPWVPFWLALGIGGWFSFSNEPGSGFYAVLAAIGAGCALAIWLAGRRAAFGLLGWVAADRIRLAMLAILLVVIGAGLAGARAHVIAAPVLDFRYYGPVEGRVVAIDRSARDRMRLVLDQLRLRDLSSSRTPERVRISLLVGTSLPVAGQRVMLTAHLSPPPGPSEPGGFDFRRMAWFEGLGAVGYTRTPVLAVAPPERGGIYALHRLRMSLAERVRQQIGGQAGAVAAALMTGDRSGIEEATNEVMRASNLYHIISISGLHMSMLAGFVYTALRLASVAVQGLGAFPRWPMHKLAAGGALMASAAYLWLSGGGVATERAFIMVAVMLIAIIADRRAISLRTVAIAAVAILAINPEALTSPGFQMSFAATVALILVQRPWLQVQSHLPWWLRPLLLLLVSSLVASMATSPIAAAHFGRMTQYGLLANMLVVPVIGMLVMPGAVIAALLAPFGLAGPALWVVGLGTRWMLGIAEWIASLSGAVFELSAAPWAVLPLAGAGAMLLLLAPVQQLLAPQNLTLLRRAAGAALLMLAALTWWGAERPLMLVAADGDAVGILTDAGRVPSRPRGGSFAVADWLDADGDPADQATAAARPLWRGEAAVRTAYVTSGDRQLAVHHLNGRTGLAAMAQVCTQGAIVISDQRKMSPSPSAAGCVLLDANTLRQTGAVALTAEQAEFRLVTTDHPDKGRFWNPAAGGLSMAAGQYQLQSIDGIE
ncbi:ComEC/Rec2 family competence protein [Paracoccus lutimaris]|uniref:Competence protein ComEC n=1 Tax=Paracoccus lutimaris TaxID=1490030 RepID=A0A368YX44_9RHOB|nr:ComEC/Rec2 family competence protein [Paracoccus lutimaris]RCW84780.1 competence protein ComEC [Paracoccus lutimaris]